MRHPARSLVLGAIGLAACQGPPPVETVLITTAPGGAVCTMARDGVQLGQVASTPGRITLPAKKGKLQVTCTKQGFGSAVAETTPGYSPDGGWVGPGGLLFVAVKAVAPPAPNSDWHYPAEIRLSLLPVGEVGHALPLSGLRLQ